MPERTTQKETYLELPEDDLSTEHLDSQVQKAQEQLLQLKHQQEQIEKQKRELEELSKRQEQLQQGKGELTEKLSRALVSLERQTYEAERRVEQLKAVHQGFNQHLLALESINPKLWDNLDINKELTKSLSIVDEGRAEYARSRVLLHVETDENATPAASGDAFQLDYEPAGQQDFLYWFKNGLAFTLPLLLLGLLILAVIVMRS